MIEASLQKAEAGTEKVQRFAAAIRRILAGERDWNRLTEDLDLDSRDALILLEVLETVAQTTIMASLPIIIQEALKQGNDGVFEQAFATLPLEEQQAVIEALSYLREWGVLQVINPQEFPEKNSDTSDVVATIQQFEPLLQAITAIALGDNTYQGELEMVLTELEAKGLHLLGSVQRIWAGERDMTVLTSGMDELDTVLVERILEIVTG